MQQVNATVNAAARIAGSENLLATVVDTLTSVIRQNSSNAAHATAHRMPRGFMMFLGGHTGPHIDTWLDRANTIMPQGMQDNEKICMLVSNIEKNQHTEGVCNHNWEGNYADFCRWLRDMYAIVVPETTISTWASVTRDQFTKFTHWQTQNTRLINITVNKWSHLGPTERHLVMEGIARIVPRAALAKYKLGNEFSEVILHNLAFMDILQDIAQHNENYYLTEWSCFDRRGLKQPLQTTTSNNIQTSYQNRNFGRGNSYRRHNPIQTQQQGSIPQQQQQQRQQQQQQQQQRSHTTNTNSPTNVHPTTNTYPSTTNQPSTTQQGHQTRFSRPSFPQDPNGICSVHGAGHRNDQCITGQRPSNNMGYRGGRGDRTQTNTPNRGNQGNSPQGNTQGAAGQQRGRGRGGPRGRSYYRGAGRGAPRQFNNIQQNGHLTLPPQGHQEDTTHTHSHNTQTDHHTQPLPPQQNFSSSQARGLGILQVNRTE